MPEAPSTPDPNETAESQESPPVREALLEEQGRLRTEACNAMEMLLAYARSGRIDEVRSMLPSPAFDHITGLRRTMSGRTPDELLQAVFSAFETYESVREGKCPLPFSREDIEAYSKFFEKRQSTYSQMQISRLP